MIESSMHPWIILARFFITFQMIFLLPMKFMMLCTEVIPFYLQVYNINNNIIIIIIMKGYYFVDTVLTMCMGENDVYTWIKRETKPSPYDVPTFVSHVHVLMRNCSHYISSVPFKVVLICIVWKVTGKEIKLLKEYDSWGTYGGKGVSVGIPNCNAMWTCVYTSIFYEPTASIFNPVMKAVCFSETKVSTYKCTWHYKPEHQHWHNKRIYPSQNWQFDLWLKLSFRSCTNNPFSTSNLISYRTNIFFFSKQLEVATGWYNYSKQSY
jgi:hypothetical protein